MDEGVIMPTTSFADHVRTYDAALSSAQCEALINRFESSPHQELCQRVSGHSFTQIDITQNWPDQNKVLVPIFHAYFRKYQEAVDARYWPPRAAFENLRVKRYLPNGRDEFPEHVDVMNHAAARRFMTAMVYLNTTQGGETTFSTLGISIRPERGKLLAFPPLWHFPHAGMPPQLGSKYILHTYLCYPSDDIT
jgi:2OG-Fe(II) oxygenase superfamily